MFKNLTKKQIIIIVVVAIIVIAVVIFLVIKKRKKKSAEKNVELNKEIEAVKVETPAKKFQVVPDEDRKDVTAKEVIKPSEVVKKEEKTPPPPTSEEEEFEFKNKGTGHK